MHPIRVMRTEQPGLGAESRVLEINSTRIRPRHSGLTRRVLNRMSWMVLVTALTASLAQMARDTPAPSLLSGPARTWAVDCANNEVLVIQHPDSYLRYR